MKNFLEKITVPYIVYLMLFLGVGFLSGAIVHYPVNPVLYGTIGAVGAIIFTLATIINEWITNKRHILQEGVIKIIFFSLILSIGLGMISGGIQHFIDFPVYASYLVPLGFVVSLIGYVLSKEIKLDTQHKLILIAKLSLISIPLFFILNYVSQNITPMPHDDGHGHGAKTKQEVTNKESMAHAAMITSDEDFLKEMIPHHQEAVETSQYLNTRTDKKELKDFSRAVIDVQTKEINQMKGWYKDWFNKEYSMNSQYKSMMGDLSKLTDKELEKEYIVGMIAHHKGAVEMAKKILTITEKEETKKMANEIITVQNQEITMLQNLLESYPHEEDEH